MGALTLKSFPFELRGWDIEKFESRISIRELIYTRIEHLASIPRKIFIALFFAPLNRRKHKTNSFIKTVCLIAIDYFQRCFVIFLLLIVILNFYNAFR